MDQNSDFTRPTQPQTSTNSVQGFDDLVKMLKRDASDLETVELAESMGKMASLVEKIAPMQESHDGTSALGPLLVDLLAALRHHRQKVTQLSVTWRELPEHDNYVIALNNFRLMLNHWLMERSVSENHAAQLAEFEALAWRTLGDGMMLMDVHQQLVLRAVAQTDNGALEPERTSKSTNWWGKIRGE